MKTRPTLSILTPALPQRHEQVHALCVKLAMQMNDLPVEHLVLMDNRMRTVGEKRDALLRASRGLYVAFVDDDDTVSGDYVSSILKAAAESDPDVITFCEWATVNGESSTVEFKLGNPNEPFRPNTTVKRNAWLRCAWRRSLAIQSKFPASNYGEDWAFTAPLCAIPNLREVHIPRILHYYIHSDSTTYAPAPE